MLSPEAVLNLQKLHSGADNIDSLQIFSCFLNFWEPIFSSAEAWKLSGFRIFRDSNAYLRHVFKAFVDF